MTLQIYWWILISLIGGLLVFMFFVQGGQTLALEIAGDETEKDMMINSAGRKWEITFTTLVLFGGACFAAFPLFYATSFGGAYWVWLAILFCFAIQAVAYEYRKKPDNFLGQKTFEAFLYINGSLGVILVGMAVATFFSGSAFVLDERNFVHWQTPWRGLEALACPFNYLLGLSLFFLSRIGGAMYFANNIDDASLRAKLARAILKNAGVFVPIFVAFLAWLVLRDGFAVSAEGVVSMQAHKYGLNLIEMPLVAILLIAGVAAVLYSIFLGGVRKSMAAIWVFGPGVVAAVMSVLLIAGLNGTSFYPSYADLQSSLTIANASSSPYTLGVMSVISLFVAGVLAYLAHAWHSIDKRKITADEMKSGHHY